MDLTTCRADHTWLVSHRVSAVVGLRREDREDGVVIPPREGVGVRDGRPLGGLELAEGTEVLALMSRYSQISGNTE